MIKVWNKQKISNLHQLEIDDWFDVLNNRLVEDRGYTLDDPNIESIKDSIKADYINYLKELVDDNRFHSYYVFKDEVDRIVSVCRIVHKGSSYYLEGLETHRDYHQKGYATKLIDSTLQLLARDGINELFSNVRVHNIPSINFHKKIGFEVFESNKENVVHKLDIDNYLRKKLFNDWSSSYNESVQKSDKNKTYPFAGHGEIQQYIFDVCRSIPNASILEMGVGTGLMTYKLYGLEHNITGVDLSEKMIDEAKKIMPLNKYILSDFESVDGKLGDNLYDVIIFSYSIHHMKPINQKYMLDVLADRLNDNGLIIIGDVMTYTNKEMKQLSSENEKIWDDEEYYPTYEEYLNPVLKQHYDISFHKVSFCSGVMELRKK